MTLIELPVTRSNPYSLCNQFMRINHIVKDLRVTRVTRVTDRQQTR